MPGFAPADEVLFFWEKDPKPMTPRSAILDGTDANLRRAVQLAALRQGPPVFKCVRPEDQTEGVEYGGAGMRLGGRTFNLRIS